jgi:hypothetical protein
MLERRTLLFDLRRVLVLPRLLVASLDCSLLGFIPARPPSSLFSRLAKQTLPARGLHEFDLFVAPTTLYLVTLLPPYSYICYSHNSNCTTTTPSRFSISISQYTPKASGPSNSSHHVPQDSPRPCARHRLLRFGAESKTIQSHQRVSILECNVGVLELTEIKVLPLSRMFWLQPSLLRPSQLSSTPPVLPPLPVPFLPVKLPTGTQVFPRVSRTS